MLGGHSVYNGRIQSDSCFVFILFLMPQSVSYIVAVSFIGG
jgi:hypothetical protein